MAESKTHVKSPISGQWLKIGSRTYLRLCKDGVLKPVDLLEKDKSVIYKIDDDNLTDKEVDIKLETAKDILKGKYGKYTTLKKGKGIYKKALVKKEKTLNHNQVKEFARNVVKDDRIQKLYNSETEYDSEELESLICEVIEEELN